MGTKIKICGITNIDDARLAAHLGADYIGLIFAEGPNRVDVARAREIRRAVPEALLVGVFRDQPLENVVQAESLDEAEEIARGNPFIASIRIYEIMAH